MKNKVYLKKTIILNIIIFLILITIFTIINTLEYHSYINNYNKKIVSISNGIKEKCSNINDNDIIEVINSISSNDLFKGYGIDIENESIIKENNNTFLIYFIIEGTIFIISGIIITYLYLNNNKKMNDNINKITKLIDEINNQNYELNIEELSEDELSILKNKIYKTTIILKESANNSLKDKLNLKKSLEDISHQIRTPLTSILINIDNILDNPNLSDDKKNAFLRKIKRESINIKNLIEIILKLSKFDVNTIKFNKEEIYIDTLIRESIDNILPLADLKNIDFVIKGKKKDKFICDLMWEKEAVSNIIKNAIEHSYKNKKVLIEYVSNELYAKIVITNEGDNISKKDIKHLFERFYKGANSSNDSIGIGLALAKAIIEEDNGKIYVESNNNITKFILKYFK